MTETQRLLSNVKYFLEQLETDRLALSEFKNMASTIPAKIPSYEQMIRLRYILESQQAHQNLLNRSMQELDAHLSKPKFRRKKSKK